ncbi:hypothetical protein BKH43_06965 [Helicobacter sp. 13S00401-1]|uniref:hypothetical protein n=1 Tax=Helicobacter sp. 13S00401-1 TaxID=1905758 RepID=UPI000BA6D49E|nr:hypothetical protein [Helicobacter sp. 13S00401-1]PAF49316.1 hypothetical protein BKH43_06965 [Helicobacter sp. 13S00401-1]
MQMPYLVELFGSIYKLHKDMSKKDFMQTVELLVRLKSDIFADDISNKNKSALLKVCSKMIFAARLCTANEHGELTLMVGLSDEFKKNA